MFFISFSHDQSSERSFGCHHLAPLASHFSLNSWIERIEKSSHPNSTPQQPQILKVDDSPFQAVLRLINPIKNFYVVYCLVISGLLLIREFLTSQFLCHQMHMIIGCSSKKGFDHIFQIFQAYLIPMNLKCFILGVPLKVSKESFLPEFIQALFYW